MRSAIALLILYVSYVTCTVHKVPLVRTYTETLRKTPKGVNPFSLSGEISLGTPPQNFMILFDTASTQFWVADDSCNEAEYRDTFNSSASSTYYGASGSLSDFDSTDTDSEAIFGNLGVDTLTIAGIQVEDVFFAGADDLNNVPYGYDGVLGLAFRQIGFNSHTSSMEDILESKQFKNKSVSLYVSENSSALILGGVDLKYAKSSFQYTPVIGNGYWSFIGHINVGTVAIATNVELIVATLATESILLPGPLFSNFLQVTGLSEGQSYQPDIVPMLRPIVIETVSGTLTIPSSVYMAENDSGLYELAITHQHTLPGMVILGDKFLALYYTHLDYEHKRIGFAEAAEI